MEQRPHSFPDSNPKFERVLLFSKIKKADHISVGRPWLGKEYIVADTDPETQTLQVIGWKTQKEIELCYKTFEIGSGCKLYRAEYVQGSFDPDYVLERAKSRVGEKEYNIFTNADTDFPRWCKTGYGGSFHNDIKAEDRYRQTLCLRDERSHFRHGGLFDIYLLLPQQLRVIHDIIMMQLSDESFRAVFDMTKQEFGALPLDLQQDMCDSVTYVPGTSSRSVADSQPM